MTTTFGANSLVALNLPTFNFLPKKTVVDFFGATLMMKMEDIGAIDMTVLGETSSWMIAVGTIMVKNTSAASPAVPPPDERFLIFRVLGLILNALATPLGASLPADFLFAPMIVSQMPLSDIFCKQKMFAVLSTPFFPITLHARLIACPNLTKLSGAGWR